MSRRSRYPRRYELQILGSYLAELIAATGKTHEQLEDESGIPASSISNYCRGRMVPDDPALLDPLINAVALRKKDRPKIRREIAACIHADWVSALMASRELSVGEVEAALASIEKTARGPK